MDNNPIKAKQMKSPEVKARFRQATFNAMLAVLKQMSKSAEIALDEPLFTDEEVASIVIAMTEAK